jgi:hypothetical protein
VYVPARGITVRLSNGWPHERPLPMTSPSQFGNHPHQG